MAKLTNPNGIGGNRTQALGPAYRISEWRGVIRIQAVQHHKKKRISAKQKQAMQEFRQLSNVAKSITVQERETAEQWAKGTQYLWRDLVYMAVSGRLMHFQDDTGGMWFSMASRTGISDVLDAISQIPGTILVRGPDWWDVIPPGLPGNVLTWPEDGQMPYWAEGAGGGGPFPFSSPGASYSNNGHATMGMIMNVPWRFRLLGWQMRYVVTEARTYEIKVWLPSGFNFGTLLSTTGDVTFPSNINPRPFVWFPDAIEIPPSTDFLVTATRKGGSGSTSCGYRLGDPNPDGITLNASVRSIAAANNNPQPTDTFFNATQDYAINGWGSILGAD